MAFKEGISILFGTVRASERERREVALHTQSLGFLHDPFVRGAEYSEEGWERLGETIL